MKWIAILGAIALGVIGFLLGRGCGNLRKSVSNEIDVVEARAHAKRTAAAKGTAEAIREIELQHAAALENFDREQMARVDSLRGDPVALAAWLTRVAQES
jgi:hypothetical protein